MYFRDLIEKDFKELSNLIAHIYEGAPESMWFGTAPDGEELRKIFEAKIARLKSKEIVDMVAVDGEGERITRFKAEKAGISNFFKVGSYGNSSKELKGIIENAIDKARKEFGVNGTPVVIASSTHAIKAAKEAGAVAVGVTSGKYSEAELEHAGADLVVKSIKDRGKILGFIKAH